MKSFAAPDGKTVRAVDGLSLAVASGELLTLVGPSGCGKTTLLRLIAGLELPDLGRISFDGHDVTRHAPKERDVAMVFQSHALFPHLTTFQNIGLGLKLRGVAREEIEGRVRDTASALGVIHCLDRKPGKLSGGERQRVALARALVRRPRILLLDEPFSNLDEPLRAQMRDELPALRERFDATIIFVTHDQEEALMLGDRVAVMRKGMIQQIDSPREIHDTPANHFVASFIGSPGMNLLHGTVAQREGHLLFLGAETDANDAVPRFCLELGSWRADWFGANVGRQFLLGLRPKHIRVVTGDGDSRGGKMVAATIKSVQFTGSETFCKLSVTGRDVTACADANAGLQAGQGVNVVFDLKHASVFDAATGAAIF